MSIIRNSLYKEILLVLLVVTLVLFLIIFSSQLTRFLAMAASGKIPAAGVFAILGYKLPAYIIMILPLSMFLAVLLVLGRMGQDNELVILLASGIGYDSIYKMVGKLAFALAIMVLLMSFFIAPYALYKSSLLQKSGMAIGFLEGLTAGKFNELPGGNRVIYAKEIIDGVMQDVFIQIETENERHVLRAETGEVHNEDGYSILKLYNGTRYSGLAGTVDYTLVTYEMHAVVIGPQSHGAYVYDTDEEPTLELWHKRDQPKVQAELQWRLAIPVMSFVLMLAGVALSSYTPRSGRYGKLLPGVILYFFYINVVSISKSRIEDGDIGAFPGIWWAHILMVLLLVWLIRRSLRRI